ncbi:MAG: HEAT repeat domain-containing protein [Pirellulales bacterium]|nr:HEAT repeat domain-containing protein [Pirellulales bacterium]
MKKPSNIFRPFRAIGFLRIACIAILVAVTQPTAAADTPRPDDPQLLLWLDAADAGTLTLDADGHVSAWANKAQRVDGKFTSGDRQRPLFVEKALGGRPALRFDGIDDVLRNAQFGRAAKTWTLVVVVNPRSNKGNGQFHGIFSANRRKTDDFVSGMNVDLGPVETSSFSELNLEGAKDEPGVRSLRTEASNFGEGQILTIVTDAALSKLFVGLEAENMRFAGDAENSLEEVRLGGRYFAGAEHGFLDGDISEVLLYDAALSDARRIALTEYLAKKYDCASKKIEYSLEGAWIALKSYDGFGSRLKLTPIDRAIRESHGNASQQKEIERRLIDVLQTEATAAAKEFAVRRLIFVGSEESIPALAKYLVDPQLGPLAQITVQAIPGEASAAALRQAVEKAPHGRQLGLIQGLGMLRDRKAVPMLAGLVKNPNADVSEAAAKALAQIGEPDCVAPLNEFLQNAGPERKSHALDVNLALARRLVEQNHPAEGAKILRALEKTSDDAGRCAILAELVEAEPQNAGLLISEALADKSPRIRGAAANLIRTTKHRDSLRVLGARFPEIPREGQILLLDALGRQDRDMIGFIGSSAIPKKDAEVRAAVFSFLGRIGDRHCVPGLVHSATKAESAAEKEAAFRSLTELHGDGIEAELIGQLRQAEAAQRAVAVRALAARQSYGAFAELAKAAKDADPAVRIEAGKAVQLLVSEKSVELLVRLLLEASDDNQQSTFEQALIAGCRKIAEPNRRAEPILAEYARANAQDQERLLPVLGALGGEKASELVHAALMDPQGKLYDSALRALANWPDASVVPELLAIAKDAKQESHRSWAIRGVARVAPRPGNLPPPEAFAAMKQAFDLADRLDDRKLVLARMGAIRTPACLAFATAKIDDAALQAEAIAAAVKLAEGMKESHPKEAKAAFERVLAATQDAALKIRIERLLGKIKP